MLDDWQGAAHEVQSAPAAAPAVVEGEREEGVEEQQGGSAASAANPSAGAAAGGLPRRVATTAPSWADVLAAAKPLHIAPARHETPACGSPAAHVQPETAHPTESAEGQSTEARPVRVQHVPNQLPALSVKETLQPQAEEKLAAEVLAGEPAAAGEAVHATAGSSAVPVALPTSARAAHAAAAAAAPADPAAVCAKPYAAPQPAPAPKVVAPAATGLGRALQSRAPFLLVALAAAVVLAALVACLRSPWAAACWAFWACK